ncbi:MAG: right-handed parallel beta-helix repeat-containing protein [Planctomycetales bacterium]|nr:right-handed parallel beta-helix repeat-containing protein [Planctomycetales bacterium]
MQRVNLSLLCLVSWLTAGIVFAQPEVMPNSTAGSASVQNFSGGATIRGTYFDVQNMTGNGVGYQNGFTQLGAFTPFWLSENSFLALNSRLILTDHSHVGVNTGAVARRYFETSDRIYGVNGYYDSDQTNFGNRYSQVTAGFETLGTNWDFRANGYFALGTTDRFIRGLGVGGDPYFVGHQIAFLGQQLREESLTGGDFEFGVPVTPATPWLRAYAGMYGYQSNAANEPIGVRGRLEAWVSDDLSVGVNVTDDRQFGTNVNAVVDFRFAGFKATRYFPQWTTSERMLMPVARNWRVATDTYSQDVNVAATIGNHSYFVTHINNTAAAGGDGTFEHPLDTLPHSAPNSDLILVQAGSTSAANPLLGELTLVNNQRLLGEGRAHLAPLRASYGGQTIDGTFVLPGFTNSGNYPFLSSHGNTITLANNNEVSAFNLLNAAGSAIVNAPAGSNNVLLQSLEITGNGGRGISLTNATGFGIMRGINWNSGSTNYSNPSGLGNNDAGGIFVDSGAAGLNLLLNDVAMNTSQGIQPFGINLQADDGSLITRLRTVQANGIASGFGNSNAGIIFGETGRNLTADLLDVSASNNLGSGLQVTSAAPGGRIVLTADNLIASGNTLDNLQIGSQVSPLLGTTFTGDFTSSTFNNSVTGAGIVYAQSGGSGTLNLSSVQANNNGLDGLGMFATSGSTMNINSALIQANNNGLDGLGMFAASGSTMNINVTNDAVNDGALAQNGRDAFHIEQLVGSSKVNLFVDPTDASQSGRDGLNFSLANGSTLKTTFLDVNLSNSVESTVDGLMNNANLELVFDHTTGDFSGQHGLSLIANAGSRADMRISNGTLANSSQSAVNTFDAVNIHADASTVDLVMFNTPTDNQGSLGQQRRSLTLDINDSLFNGTVSAGNLSGNLMNAVNASVTNGATARLDLVNSPGNSSGADGFVATVDNSQFRANLTNSNFNNSGIGAGGNGMIFNVTNGGVFTAGLDNSSFNNSGADGLHGVVNASVANLTLTNSSTVRGNDRDGLDFNVDAGLLTVNATNSSFSNNGVGGVTGNGILGVIGNGGLATLEFVNTPVRNNFNNGMSVTATGGSNVQAAFDNSPFAANGLITDGDGIRLDLSGSPSSSLTLTNNSNVNGNGGDGVELNATDGTVFTQAFSNLTVSDNGQTASTGNGFVANVDVTGTGGSTVDLTFNTVSLVNNLPNATQQVGFLFDVRNTGTLTAGFTDSDLSNNFQNAINGNVQDAGTVATVAMSNTVADNSGVVGAIFNVTNGGVLNFAATNNSSISNSGAAGVLVNVDGAGSQANFEFNQLSLNANGLVFGGEGFIGTATGGGNLNACIAASSISGNANQGIELAIGLNSLAIFDVRTSVIDNNGSEGLLADVDGGTFYYRSVGNTYNNNGTNGGLAGVSVTATGTGAADTATAILLFSGDTVSANDGDGFFFNAQNGATLTASLDADTITNNGASGTGFGVNFNANGTNTKANLLLTGVNDLAGNASGPFQFGIGAIDTTVLSLSGSFDNSVGDGIFIDLNGVQNATVAVQGPGTIDGSGGDGIDVRMTNVINGSVLISGLTSINSSAGDAIHLEMDNVFRGAIEISGPAGGTSINDSGDDGIDIFLSDTVLIDDLETQFAATSINVITPTSNLSSPLNGCLPLAVSTNFNSFGLIPTDALAIDTISTNRSAGQGINIHSPSGQTSAIATATVSNSVLTQSAGGDGIHFGLFDTSVNSFSITGNEIADSRDHGVALTLDNSPIGTLNLTDNQIDPNGGDGILLSSQNGSNIGAATISRNTIQNNALHGIEIQAINSTLPSGSAPMIVSSNTISNNAGGDGFRMINPSTGAVGIGLSFTDNTISDNTGTGVNLSLLDLVGQGLTSQFTNNIISGNTGGPGVNIELADNRGFAGGFVGNTVTQSGAGGINIAAGANGFVNSDFSSNTVNENLVGSGISIAMGHDTSFTGNFDANQVNQNGAEGVQFASDTNGIITADFTDNTINGNTSHGIDIALGTGGQLNSVNFYGNTIGTETLGNGGMGLRLVAPALSTFTLNMGDAAQAANNIDFNTDAAVGITTTGGPNSTLNIINSSLSNTLLGADANFQGDGLAVLMAGGSTVSGSIVSSTLSSNAGGGIRFNVSGNNAGTFAVLNNMIIGGTTAALGNTVSENGGNGLEILRVADGQVNAIQILNNIIDNSGQNGMRIMAANKNQIDTYTINNNAMTSSGANGILFEIKADADLRANMDMNTITDNGANGILLTEELNNPVDSRSFQGTWTRNLIADNEGRGIELQGVMDGLLIGDATNLNLGNVIARNNQDGIRVTSPGAVTIGSNVIQENGTLANLGTASENAGIMMNAQVGSRIIVTNNLITDNFGDGVQFSKRDQVLSFLPQEITITDNAILGNSGRGIDLINQGNNFLRADITGNEVNSNQLEGVYLVNTSSVTQNQFSSSTAAMASDGDVNATPTLELRFSQNQVRGNGINSNLAGTGLIVRIGTSDGGGGVTDAGGFASTGGVVPINGSPFGLSSRAGVTMAADNNNFGGNFGDDIVFTSFVSTTAPSTGTAWVEDTTSPAPVPPVAVFDPAGYQSDPLSRFDLYFRGNTYDPLSLDPVGNDLGGFTSRNPALVAFYNTSDGVFKSRLDTIAAPDVPGPFTSDSRARNATRQAARIPLFNAPTGPGLVGDSFLYPGMGQSTWRVNTVDPAFIFDVNPYVNTNDSRGRLLDNAVGNGELRYGWGRLP